MYQSGRAGDKAKKPPAKSGRVCISVNVQGICDFERKFIDVDCRWPGSIHDA